MGWYSTLQLMMPWCLSTRASLSTVLTKIVIPLDHFQYRNSTVKGRNIRQYHLKTNKNNQVVKGLNHGTIFHSPVSVTPFGNSSYTSHCMCGLITAPGQSHWLTHAGIGTYESPTKPAGQRCWLCMVHCPIGQFVIKSLSVPVLN